MKTFAYSPKNTFAKKTYTIEERANSKTSVTVRSPFLGRWEFTIDIPVSSLTEKLEEYCQGDKTIQDVFSTLSPQTRDLFIADPSIYEKTTDCN